jgi:hypothetical protein
MMANKLMYTIAIPNLLSRPIALFDISEIELLCQFVHKDFAIRAPLLRDIHLAPSGSPPQDTAASLLRILAAAVHLKRFRLGDTETWDKDISSAIIRTAKNFRELTEVSLVLSSELDPALDIELTSPDIATVILRLDRDSRYINTVLSQVSSSLKELRLLTWYQHRAPLSPDLTFPYMKSLAVMDGYCTDTKSLAKAFPNLSQLTLSDDPDKHLFIRETATIYEVREDNLKDVDNCHWKSLKLLTGSARLLYQCGISAQVTHLTVYHIYHFADFYLKTVIRNTRPTYTRLVLGHHVMFNEFSLPNDVLVPYLCIETSRVLSWLPSLVRHFQFLLIRANTVC